jgi:hypothetical protein
MRSSALEVLDDPHSGHALIIRGRAMRTFSSMAIFIALTLLALGVYIIREEFANPMAAQSVALLTAAFVLTTGLTLLLYLIPPRTSGWRPRSSRASSISLDWIVWASENPAPEPRGQRTDLPFQRWYVDPARIRPRR